MTGEYGLVVPWLRERCDALLVRSGISTAVVARWMPVENNYRCRDESTARGVPANTGLSTNGGGGCVVGIRYVCHLDGRGMCE